MELKNIAILGNGKMAYDCLKLLHQHPQCKVSLVACDANYPLLASKISTYCNKNSISYHKEDCFNAHDFVNHMRSIQLDFVFSINNFRVLDSNLINIPKLGIVNFHNGPLPLYRGINIPSWAIINGEHSHGVTWHFIDKGIDTGDIIYQKMFDLDGKETALDLTFKCIEEGTELFRNNVDEILSENFKRSKQQGKSSYYSKLDTPNNGEISFHWPGSKIDRHVRGLNFRPFINTFVDAKISIKNNQYIIHEVEHLPINDKIKVYKPGEIISINSKHIEIATIDGSLIIKELYNINQTTSPIEFTEDNIQKIIA